MEAPMKRRHLGWPPRTSDRHSTFNAAAIDRAVAAANRRPAPCRCAAEELDPLAVTATCPNCGALPGERCRQRPRT
jgi:hypothetical protein